MSYHNYSYHRTGGRGGTFSGRGFHSGRGRGQRHPTERPNTKWVRPKEPSMETPATSSSGEVEAMESNPLLPKVDDVSSNQQSNNMVKRGRNQLVLLSKNETESIRMENSETKAGTTTTNTNKMETTVTTTQHNNSHFLTKVSKNKLVLRNSKGQELESNDSNQEKATPLHKEHTSQEGKAQSMAPSSLSSSSSSSHYPSGEKLQKVGKHKLVPAQQFTNYKVPPTSAKRPTQQEYKDRRPIPKRIKLTVQQASPTAEESDQMQGEEGCTTEKLSDFAYRETRLPARGRKAGNRNAPRSMGLIRASISKAPICPTFVRGMECTDAFCRKRHDIPRESTMPVCSYFQRNGQCLKEDCKFRHVKVNPIAMDCPSFALLGFCEDMNCPMKHEYSEENIKKDRTVKQNRKYIRDER